MAQPTVQSIIDRLCTRTLSLKKPARVWDSSLSDQIASLKLHPAIESGLHILNDDLVSAHFLVRHCDGQKLADYWHGILHRIENDFRNSRAWYHKRIDSAQLGLFYASREAAEKFVWDCQNVVVDHNTQGHDVGALEQQSMNEIRGLLNLSIKEFGLNARDDVSEYYSSHEGTKELKFQMTTGQVKREGHENE